METEDSEEAGRNEGKLRAVNRVLVMAAMVLGGLLAFHGLGNSVFTEDEANTALFARNLIEFGERTAWDGRNLIGYAFGEELDENLSNIKIPAQQFYIAAAGMTLFGETTTGARLLFVVIGIGGIGLTAWWASLYLGCRLPFGVAAILVALSPAYLLAIRNCRYFAPSFFWALLLLVAWTAVARSWGEKNGSGQTRGRWMKFLAAGVIAVPGLFTANDLLAAACLAVLPVFFLDARFRRRSQVLFLAILYAVALPCALWALVRLNVFTELVTRREAAAGPWWETFCILVWRHVRDMGTFEYFAWPMLLPLALPYVLPKLRAERALASRGLILCGVMAVYIAFISLVSPTRIDLTEYADMRYLLPLIAAGALVSTVSCVILWRLFPAGAVVLGLALVFTNALYPGHEATYARFFWTDRAPIRSTLVDYVYENLHPYRSAYGRLVDWLAENVPAETEVRIIPFNAVYPAMFHVPELRYCAQLSTERPVREEIARNLPDYVYREKCRPALLLVHPSAAPGQRLEETMERVVEDASGARVVLRYRYEGIAPMHWPSGSGPNIPFHYFYAPPPAENEVGFLVYRLEGGG